MSEGLIVAKGRPLTSLLTEARTPAAYAAAVLAFTWLCLGPCTRAAPT
jgi:hypothetical protein